MADGKIELGRTYWQRTLNIIEKGKKYKDRHQNIKKMKKEMEAEKRSISVFNAQRWALRRAQKKKLNVPQWLKNCPVEKKRLNQIYLLSRIYANADGEKRHVDHMWPLSDGGPHWSGNLQILTATKNLEKGAYSCPKLKKQMKLNLKEAESEYARKRNST